MYENEKKMISSSYIQLLLIPLKNVAIVTNAIFITLLSMILPFYVLFLKPHFIFIEPQDATVFSVLPISFFPKYIRPIVVLDARTNLVIEKLGLRGYLKELIFKFSFRTAEKMFDGITTITNEMKNQICVQYKLDPKNVGVWASGVNFELFDPERFRDRGKKLKEKLGLKNKFVVLYHGSFSVGRGLTEAIESINLLKRKNPNVVLFLLGNGELSADMKSLVEKYRIEGNVIIHGPVDYECVPKYIAMCDIGIFVPQNLQMWKGQCPLKLLEYLAMEKVVIITNIQANLNVIGKHKCGIIISSAEPKRIAKAITYAYKNKEKLQEWGKIGRIIVEKRYTWEKAAENLEIYLNKLRRGIKITNYKKKA